MKKPIDVYRLLKVLKRFEGQAINTYNGKPNKIIKVYLESMSVGSTRSPKGEPVSMEDIREALETLIEKGEIDIHHASPRSYRGSFVVALLLNLPGVEKDPNVAGAVISDRAALESVVYAEGV